MLDGRREGRAGHVRCGRAWRDRLGMDGRSRREIAAAFGREAGHAGAGRPALARHAGGARCSPARRSPGSAWTALERRCGMEREAAGLDRTQPRRCGNRRWSGLQLPTGRDRRTGGGRTLQRAMQRHGTGYPAAPWMCAGRDGKAHDAARPGGTGARLPVGLHGDRKGRPFARARVRISAHAS